MLQPATTVGFGFVSMFRYRYRYRDPDIPILTQIKSKYYFLGHGNVQILLYSYGPRDVGDMWVDVDGKNSN